MTSSIEATNAKLVKFVPELSSDYAKYPMTRDRWLSAKEKGPKGEPCFIAGPSVGPKPDYVYGRGTFGEGYYHLLTKQSYCIVYARHLNEYPGGCCPCFSSKAVRKELDEYDDVRLILHARSVATIPNDGQAAQDALAGAKATAQAWNAGLQTEALAVGAIQLST